MNSAIIEPINKEVLIDELSSVKKVRNTNNGGNELYIVNHNNAPNVLQEIGRLRELTFRAAGGGTGKEMDLDAYDLNDNPYEQLIVWDPDKKEILGGYRYKICKAGDQSKALATSKLFNFSDQFVSSYLPHTIELGRSFVQPEYQMTTANKENGIKRNIKGLYALDNLWDGLGTLVVNNPEMKYFFGKVTMYRNYNQRARNLLLYFMDKHFPDRENLVTPISQIQTGINLEEMRSVFLNDTYLEDYKILSQKVRAFGENIPPLINAYMSLSPSMKTFGTVINNTFGDVEETAIMVTINDLYKEKVERHVNNYSPDF